MSYVVLARKYRPMRFADMVGQEHIGRTLGNAITQDRVHHAYLFSGARGLGKTTTARIFAKGLVCQKGPTPNPCNECSECVAVSEGRSVDVMEIDGASNNSVDNIRNLREQVNYLPQTARRKVYIIDEVHMLTTSAFNALLKTLEEPPAHVNFVFATTEPHKVLPTILSRVNRLDFKRVSPTQLVEFLRSILEREKLSVDDGGLRIVARAGGGSVRDALTLLDQVIAFAEDATNVAESEVRRLLGQADVAAVHDLVDAILDRDPTAAMQRFDGLVTGGNDLVVLSLQVLEHLRDLTVIRVCGTSQVLPDATEAEVEQLRQRASTVDASHLGQLFDRFSRVIDRLPQTRTPRLLVEMGLLDLACSEPVMPLGDLVDRLHAIGNGAPPPSGGGGRGGPPRGRTPARGGGSPPRSRGGETRGFVPPAPPPFEDAPPPASRVPTPSAAPARPTHRPPAEPRFAAAVAPSSEATSVQPEHRAVPAPARVEAEVRRQDPAVAEAAPTAVEPVAAAAETKPAVAVAEAKPEVAEAKPEVAEAKPEVAEAKPEPAVAVVETKPEVTAAEVAEAGRGDAAAQPEVAAAVEAEPEVAQTEPALTAVPEAPPTAPEPAAAEAKPALQVVAKPDPAPGLQLVEEPRPPERRRTYEDGDRPDLEPPPWLEPSPSFLALEERPSPHRSRAPQAEARPAPREARPTEAPPSPSPSPSPSLSFSRPSPTPEPQPAPSQTPRVAETPAARTPSAPTPAAPAPDSFAAKLFDMVRDSGAINDGPPPSQQDAAPPPPPSPAVASPRSHGHNGSNGNGARAGNDSGANGSASPSIRMGVGPCLPSPPADGVIEWEELEPFDAWGQLVARIRSEDEFVAAVLGELGLVALAGGVLRVAAPRGSFAHTELNRHPQLRAQLEQACRDHLGAPFAIELAEGEPALPELPSLVLVAQQRRAEHRAQVESEAREHPGINVLLRTFNAELLGTKPLQEA